MQHTVIFADDHVLDGFTGPGHVHGVGQVRPAQARVVDLVLQHLVRVEAYHPRNIIILCTTPGMSLLCVQPPEYHPAYDARHIIIL